MKIELEDFSLTNYYKCNTDPSIFERINPLRNMLHTT